MTSKGGNRTIDHFFQKRSETSGEIHSQVIRQSISERFIDTISKKFNEIVRWDEYLDCTCSRCQRRFLETLDYIPGSIMDYIHLMGEHITKCSKRYGDKVDFPEAISEANAIMITHINNHQSNRKPIRDLMFTIQCDVCKQPCKDHKSIGANLYEYVLHLKEHHKGENMKALMDQKYIKFVKYIES